ncbi:MAG TPA: CoA-transferase, partial [Candidatus Methylomirabilis sp.]|nr:CoA-transferase [Candidatus Methylomirabilis sp.]
HELIRQRRRDLTLIGPISDILFDQLIGAGCVSRLIAAWVGNVSAGLGHNYRRAVEAHIPNRLIVEDHSNLTIAVALLAGGLGAPFIPTRSLLGTDLLVGNPSLRAFVDPDTGAPLVLVRAMKPDIAILQVQRSDDEGHAHCWGNLGVCEEGGLASQGVVLVAEEVVPREVILSDPNRILLPSSKVVAVVSEPWGAHPSPVQGCYSRDHEFYRAYHEASRTQEGFQRWLKAWVLDVRTRTAYLTSLGEERLRRLKPSRRLMAAPVDYGY